MTASIELAGTHGEGPPPVTTTEPTSAGTAPWRLAVRRFRSNRPAMLSVALFLLLVLSAVLAPLYASQVAHTDPFRSNLAGTTTVHGRVVKVLAPNASGFGSSPLAPTWSRYYFLGADTQGRDVAARLVYAGRTSLLVGLGSAVVTAAVATALALVAGFFGGWVDQLISRLLDLLWAFPVYLLAISLSTVLLLQGLRFGPIQVDPTSLWLPTLIIAIIYVPYLARPIRGEVLSLRRREFVEAAVGQGLSRRRIIVGELLPNVVPTVLVFLPLMIATNILTESSLSYLSIGVQPPSTSWGTMITDGQSQLYTRPWASLGPGLVLTAAIIVLNVIGEGLRDAIDPRGLLARRPRRQRRTGRATSASDRP